LEFKLLYIFCRHVFVNLLSNVYIWSNKVNIDLLSRASKVETEIRYRGFVTWRSRCHVTALSDRYTPVAELYCCKVYFIFR